MRIKISAGAERDIAEGCDFYGYISGNLATYFHDSISADIDSLLLYSGVHAKVNGWHYTFASRFPFVIWYGVKDDIVVVYAVLDSRRDPERNARMLRQRRLNLTNRCTQAAFRSAKLEASSLRELESRIWKVVSRRNSHGARCELREVFGEPRGASRGWLFGC